MEKQNEKLTELTLDQMDKVSGGTGEMDPDSVFVLGMSTSRPSIEQRVQSALSPEPVPEVTERITDAEAARAQTQAMKEDVLTDAVRKMLAEANRKSSEILSLLG